MGATEMRDPIEALAAGQHGVVTRRQLLDAGLSAGAIQRRVRRGRLRPEHRGVYLVGPVQSPRARPLAAVLAAGPGAVVSHGSAASLWEVRPAPGPNHPVDLTVPGGGRHPRPGIRFHRAVPITDAERTVLQGIPITAPGRTLVDLAGVAGSRELERAVALAERRRLVTLRELAALVVRHAGRPGIPALRSLLDAEGGPRLTRSELEARLLELIREARLPMPETNVAVGPYELDFFWPAEGIAIETDGYRHHSSRPRFEGDRHKDIYLAARGITVIRLSWKQVVKRRTATVVEIGQALVLAAARGERAGG